jgi:Novel toxin 11
MPIDAAAEYHKRFPQSKRHDRLIIAPTKPADRKVAKPKKEAIHAALALRGQDEQYRTDAAFWYGTLIHQSIRWKTKLLNRIFEILHFGGLMYRTEQGDWRAWHGTGWPIAAALSHSARVLIQLEPGAAGQELWAWLWCDQNPQTRSAATHGLDLLANPLPLMNGRARYFDETKKSSVAQHGVNIALGGYDNTNPHSETRITDNGEHGHLYLGYRQPTGTNPGAILVGCEPSAPADRWEGHSTGGPGMWYNAACKGVPDQQGEQHGLGGGQDYSATGGTRWDRGIFQNDKKRPKYYGGILVDVSQPGDCQRFVDGQYDFSPYMVGEDGEPVPQEPLPVVRIHQRGVRIIKDYKGPPPVVRIHQRGVRIIDDYHT